MRSKPNTIQTNTKIQSQQNIRAEEDMIIIALEDYFRRSALSKIHPMPRWMP
ncbi:MAG: hypothetical protein K2X53_02665 [Alphaproteobacteria bacterium]|nr:hypothetical protein [Alphaproteobacteria bacterium]